MATVILSTGSIFPLRTCYLSKIVKQCPQPYGTDNSCHAILHHLAPYKTLLHPTLSYIVANKLKAYILIYAHLRKETFCVYYNGEKLIFLKNLWTNLILNRVVSTRIRIQISFPCSPCIQTMYSHDSYVISKLLTNNLETQPIKLPVLPR